MIVQRALGDETDFAIRICQVTPRKGRGLHYAARPYFQSRIKHAVSDFEFAHLWQRRSLPSRAYSVTTLVS